LEDEIHSELEIIGKDENLYEEKNFILRAEAVEHIDFHIIDRIHAHGVSRDNSDQMNYLLQYAEKLKCQLEEVDASMFHRLRKTISEGGYRGKQFIDLIDEYLADYLTEAVRENTVGYDPLDMFLNGLLNPQKLPDETKEREPEMVFYQKTPARVILELLKKATFKPSDVFFDLGSGLGQVVILVNLLSSVISKGVEFDPAFCDYAKTCAADLNLNEVDFINTDARYADYSTGTVFFMYTPFEGKMLIDTLQKLRAEAKKRKIRVFTYGPCTPEVAKQGWLINSTENQECSREFGAFHSI
jgi:hypothetical protein